MLIRTLRRKHYGRKCSPAGGTVPCLRYKTQLTCLTDHVGYIPAPSVFSCHLFPLTEIASAAAAGGVDNGIGGKSLRLAGADLVIPSLGTQVSVPHADHALLVQLACITDQAIHTLRCTVCSEQVFLRGEARVWYRLLFIKNTRAFLEILAGHHILFTAT